MAVHYENGVEIEKISRKELNNISVSIDDNEYRLSARLLADRAGWAEIYIKWIVAGLAQMWFRRHGGDEVPEKEQLRAAKLFQEGADGKACEIFLDEYCAMLVDPYFPNVGNDTSAQRICGEIDNKLAQAEPYLRLRVKVVCLLADSFPQKLFSEGAGWAGLFTAPQDAAKLQASEISVKKNDVFELDPCDGLGKPLVPRTLRNGSGNACRIEIRCGGIGYPVRLPSYGALRAVFADGGETIVSLKGCISCCDTQNVVLQRGGKEGIQLFSAAKGRTAVELRPLSLPWDACADMHGGTPGAVILTANELYSTLTGLLQEGNKETPLPIRCYRAGNQWAWLYEDGELDSSLPGTDGGRMHDVTAVAEDAERGLLICHEGKFFDYRATFKQEVSKEVFIRTMLSRFTQAEQGECEVQKTGFMRWAILDSGEVKQ